MTAINPIFKPFIKPHRYKVAKVGAGQGKAGQLHVYS